MTRRRPARPAGPSSRSGLLESIGCTAWATLLLVAALAKLTGGESSAAWFPRMLERAAPDIADETLICAELGLGIAILFGGMPVARVLTISTAVLCALGNAALWMLEGDRDCGCLGAFAASHSIMLAGATTVALVTWFGRSAKVVTVRSRTLGSVAAVGLALMVAAAALDRPSDASPRPWHPAIAHATTDGDVILFGSSTCDVCAAIGKSDHIDIGTREVPLDSVILVYRMGDDAHLRAGHPYKRVMQIDAESWWTAVGASAPAAYVVDGDRIRRVEVAPGHEHPAKDD